MPDIGFGGFETNEDMKNMNVINQEEGESENKYGRQGTGANRPQTARLMTRMHDKDDEFASHHRQYQTS